MSYKRISRIHVYMLLPVISILLDILDPTIISHDLLEFRLANSGLGEQVTFFWANTLIWLKIMKKSCRFVICKKKINVFKKKIG